MKEIVVTKTTQLTQALEKAHQKDTVLVYFHADWCKPCKNVKSAMAILPNEKSEAGFLSVDIESEAGKSLAKKHSIRNLPTVIAFQQGDVLFKIVGALKQDDYIKMLKDKLKSVVAS